MKFKKSRKKHRKFGNISIKKMIGDFSFGFMNEVGRVSKAGILSYFEAKSTDNVVYWRAFSTIKEQF